MREVPHAPRGARGAAVEEIPPRDVVQRVVAVVLDVKAVHFRRAPALQQLLGVPREIRFDAVAQADAPRPAVTMALRARPVVADAG